MATQSLNAEAPHRPRATAAAERQLAPFRYVHSRGLPELLEQLNSTLVVSTYQAGKLSLFRARQGRLSLLTRTFQQAMGVAVARERIAVGTQHQVWFLENDPDIARSMQREAGHDACFLPRRSHVTGNIHVHELASGRGQMRSAAPSEYPGMRNGEEATQGTGRESASATHDTLWLVNTLFSCLCTLHPDYSFVPAWRPPFVSAIAAEDRCHLNGLAMADGRPKFVSAFAETDEPDGWRANKAATGCVIDIESGETVIRGLSMPHSPRVHQGQLFLLDSGTGRLLAVDPPTGDVQQVAALPGYTRGLALVGDYAFVGLSTIRETATFGGVPIAEHRD